MFSSLSSAIENLFGELLGNVPRVGQPITAEVHDNISAEMSHDSSEEVLEEISRIPSSFPYPDIGEDRLYFRVIETKLHSFENKNKNNEKNQKTNKSGKKQGKNDRAQKNVPDQDSNEESSDENEKNKLEAIGCYNEKTQKIRMRLQVRNDSSFKTITQRLSYRGKELPKQIILDVTAANLKANKSKFLEISIDEVDRHVFHKTFNLIFKYKIVGNNEDAAKLHQIADCYEAKLEFEVRLVIT